MLKRIMCSRVLTLVLLAVLFFGVVVVTAGAVERQTHVGIWVDGKYIACVENMGQAVSALESILDDGGEGHYVALQECVTARRCIGCCELISGEALRQRLAQEVSLFVVAVEQEGAAVPAGVVYLEDESMYAGEEMVSSYGVDGLRITQYRRAYVDGELAWERVENTHVLREPKDAVVLRGVKQRLSSGTYLPPAQGIISSQFGPRWGKTHEGVDIAGELRTPITASDGGRVAFADEFYDYGNLVRLEHENGDETWYAHLDELAVCEGDEVLQGDLLGYMGDTGRATGVHLHFEYHPAGGEPVDPLTVIKYE